MLTVSHRGNKKDRFYLAGLLLGSLLLLTSSVLALPDGGFRTLLQAAPGKTPNLESILKAAAEYCEKVKNMALFYVCQEKITDKEYFFRYNKLGPSGFKREERIFDIRRVDIKTYLFDYQLVKKGDQVAEDRTLLMENGRKRNVKNATLKDIQNSGQFLIYGPVGFLSQYWQSRFRYSLVGEEVVDGLPAVIIQAVPTEKREDNDQIGRIWIGPDNQVLRVELEPTSLKEYEDEVLTSPLGEFHKKMIWTIDYSIEKNGVRFPGRQRIQKLFGSPPPNSPLPGVPAEIFINPVQAVEGYLKEEQEDATPMTAHMLATGFVVLEQDPIIADLRGRARALLERPPQAGPQKLTFFRYTAATIYEDAVDMVDANPETAAMILARAVGEMLRFAFHAAGRFLPREKDLLRALEELDPLLAELARSFYRATSLPERLSLAESIAGRTIGVKGFFEWESEYEEVNTRK